MDNILEVIKERWDINSERYDSTHNGSYIESDLEIWRNILEQYIGRDRNAEVLDVGAGTGFLTILIAELKYKCYGLDISDGMLDIARKHTAEKKLDIKFFQGTVDKLPFKNDSLDVITNKSFLWTILNPDTIMKEWMRVLKPGGKLLCFCTIGNEPMKGNHYDQEIEDILPLKNASEDKLINTLVSAGFSDVEAIKLDQLKNNHGDKSWYIIKGKK